jgi:NAD(P)-dependent dehydrogenase (short-subunit alcohol dehydrogenase family)
MVNPTINNEISGRVLHISSGAAHGAPPVGWSVYGITKAAFFQSFKVLDREFREKGSKVIVGSFKPGIVDTDMQSIIRNSSNDVMPLVQAFQQMKEKTESSISDDSINEGNNPRPPPNGALDTPDNVANFAEYLLLGTSDEEFANKDDPNEHDIRDTKHHPLWIPTSTVSLKN